MFVICEHIDIVVSKVTQLRHVVAGKIWKYPKSKRLNDNEFQCCWTDCNKLGGQEKNNGRILCKSREHTKMVMEAM